MPKTVALQTETKAQLPKPTSTQTLPVNGQNYLVLRFKEGPDFAQTKDMAKNLGMEMLQFSEVWKINDDKELDFKFREMVNAGEWAYVRDPSAELESYVPYMTLSSSRDGQQYFAVRYGRLNWHAELVILKETGSKVAAPQAQANESILRPTEPKE